MRALLTLLALLVAASPARAQRIVDLVAQSHDNSDYASGYINLNVAGMGVPNALNQPLSPSSWAEFTFRFNTRAWISLTRDGVLLNSVMGHSIPVTQVCQVSYDRVHWSYVPCMGFDVSPRTPGTMEYLYYRLSAYSGSTAGAPSGYYDSGFVGVRILAF